MTAFFCATYQVLFLCMMMPFSTYAQTLTIMTAPVGQKSYGKYQETRSVLKGLYELHVPYRYNPASFKEVTDTVLVLADQRALLQAITFKQQKRIRRIIAGPTIVTRADEYGGILASPEIDICLVPSLWVQQAYEEQLPALKGKIRCWYAGVDTTYWQSSSADIVVATKDALVYWKTEPEEFVEAVESALKLHGWVPHRIRYGFYKPEEYKALLSRCRIAVFISKSEQQGLALAEAWAMNVPTLVWDPQLMSTHEYTYSFVSSCPYLTKQTGQTWKTMSDLNHRLSSLGRKVFSPREWVLAYMTYEQSSLALLRIINE